MPIEEVSPGRFRWGKQGKIYTSRAGAEAQARAVYANGYREDRQVRKAVRALRPPRGAEARYALDLATIMGAVHHGIMMVVEREHLADGVREDGELETKPPLVRQETEWSCGAAVVLSLLRLYAPHRFGGMDERELYEALGTTESDGTGPQRMADVLAEELGRHVEARWPSSVHDVQRALDQGEPVIINLQAWRTGKTDWSDDWDDGHYVVAVGYKPDAFLFMDPSTPDAYGTIPRTEFMNRWHDVLRDGTRVQNLAIFVGPVHKDAKPPPVGLTDRLLRKIIKFQTPHVEKAYNRMADTVHSNGAEQMYLLGIAPRSVAGLDSVISHARAENVKLVTNASQAMLEKIRDTLEETEGDRPEEIAKKLEPIAGIGKRRGMLIARTETTKLNSQLVQHRARAAGLSKYRWSGALDERERPSHVALEGKVFSWDDPPEPEDDGNAYHPGEFPNCRCVPLPYIEELEEPVGEGEEEPDVDEPDIEPTEEEPEEEGEEETDARDVVLKPPPRKHLVGMVVPHGGSSCAKCAFVVVDQDTHSEDCSQTGWVETAKDGGGGGGDTRLPAPADEFCCDFFEPEDKQDWDEELHPRGPDGRFGASGGHALERGGTEFGRVSREPARVAPTAPEPPDDDWKPPPGTLGPEHFASITGSEVGERRAELEQQIEERQREIRSGEYPRATGEETIARMKQQAAAIEEPNFAPADIIRGFQHEGVANWLSDPKTKPELRVDMEFNADDKNTRGQYSLRGDMRTDGVRNGLIAVDPNVPRPAESEVALPPGDTWTVSYREALKSRYDHVLTNFSHELGHHLHVGPRL